jgi:hypothetical protein
MDVLLLKRGVVVVGVGVSDVVGMLRDCRLVKRTIIAQSVVNSLKNVFDTCGVDHCDGHMMN